MTTGVSREAKTIRDVLQETDAANFTGREAELAAAAKFLEPNSSSRILYIHGPGGIGKSALLRAIGRAAVEAGFKLSAHDARSMHLGLGALLATLSVGADRPTLLVIDEVDHLGSMLAPLREALLDLLPADSRIAMAGRNWPDETWRGGGLPEIVVDLLLSPLSRSDAEALLEHKGISDPSSRSKIAAWAKGYPLALMVAASIPGSQSGVLPEAELEDRLIGWLSGGAILDINREVLAAAAIARVLDSRLLSAALPGRNTREILPRLQALPVIQPLGSGVSLHPVLAHAIRERMKSSAPQRYRALVKRISEHLATRARMGDMEALIELSQLIEDEGYRRAIGNEPSPELYADKPRQGEFEDFGRRNGFDAEADWNEVTRWRATGSEFVLRRSDGGIQLWVCLIPMTELTGLGPMADSQLEALKKIGSDPRRSYGTLSMFAEGTLEERAEAGRLASGAFMRHAGVPDLEVILMCFPRPNRRTGPTAINNHDLDDVGSHTVVVSDFRPLGAVGFVEAIVLNSLGISAPTEDKTGLLADNDDPERKAKLERAMDEVFSDSVEDRRLRSLLEAVHLKPRSSEAALLAEFHVGRSTLYRMLRTARERILAGGRAATTDISDLH